MHMGSDRKQRGRGSPRLPDSRTQEIFEGREIQSRPSTTQGLTQITAASFELRKGPIPDAEEMVRYGQAHPQAPAIILEEFKRQAAHRRVIERRAQSLGRKSLEAAIFSERLGVFSALLIALVGFGCATFLVASGHGIAGTVIFGLDVGALVSAFILGRSKAGEQKQPEVGATQQGRGKS